MVAGSSIWTEDPKHGGYVQPRIVSEVPRRGLVRSVQTGLTVLT